MKRSRSIWNPGKTGAFYGYSQWSTQSTRSDITSTLEAVQTVVQDIKKKSCLDLCKYIPSVRKKLMTWIYVYWYSFTYSVFLFFLTPCICILSPFQIVLPILYFIPDEAAYSGRYEDSIDAMYQIKNSPKLLLFCILYLLSIAFYNYFGLAVTKSLTGK